MEGRRSHSPPSRQRGTLCSTGLRFHSVSLETAAHPRSNGAPQQTGCRHCLSSLAGGQRKRDTYVHLHPPSVQMKQLSWCSTRVGPCNVILASHTPSPSDRSIVHSFVRSWIYQAPTLDLQYFSRRDCSAVPTQMITKHSPRSGPSILPSCHGTGDSEASVQMRTRLDRQALGLKAPEPKTPLLCQVNRPGLNQAVPSHASALLKDARAENPTCTAEPRTVSRPLSREAAAKPGRLTQASLSFPMHSV